MIEKPGTVSIQENYQDAERSSSLKSAHCKERQLERGISDSDIDRAVGHGANKPGSGNRRRVHTGGGVAAVIATGKNVAAWRAEKHLPPRKWGVCSGGPQNNIM